MQKPAVMPQMRASNATRFIHHALMVNSAPCPDKRLRRLAQGCTASKSTHAFMRVPHVVRLCKPPGANCNDKRNSLPCFTTMRSEERVAKKYRNFFVRRSNIEEHQG